MDNKDLTLEERLKKEEKNIVNYNPISANESYDMLTFVKKQGELNNLEEYVQAIGKDPYNVGAREDLSYLIFGDSRVHVGMSPEEIRKIGNDAYSDGIEKMSKYAERNYDNMIGKLEGEDLKNIAMNLPLYKTSDKKYKSGEITKDNEHNKLVDTINEIRLMNSDDEEIKGKVVNNALSKVINSKEVPDWVKNLIQYFAGTNAHFVNEIFARYKTGMVRAFSEYITREGQVDKDKLKSLVDTSLKVAYAEFNELDEKENVGERKDIWEQAIRPYHIVIAKSLYKPEKKKLEENIDKKKEKSERKEFRRKLGMAA